MLIIELARYIHSQEIGIFDESGISGNIFMHTMPASPDECIGIYSRQGYASVSDAKLGYDEKTIQFIVRGSANPISAEVKAKAIYDALHGFDGILGEANILNCVGMNGGPYAIGKDENNRHEFSVNFAIEVRNKSQHRE